MRQNVVHVKDTHKEYRLPQVSYLPLLPMPMKLINLLKQTCVYNNYVPSDCTVTFHYIRLESKQQCALSVLLCTRLEYDILQLILHYFNLI